MLFLSPQTLAPFLLGGRGARVTEEGLAGARSFRGPLRGLGSPAGYREGRDPQKPGIQGPGDPARKWGGGWSY